MISWREFSTQFRHRARAVYITVKLAANGMAFAWVPYVLRVVQKGTPAPDFKRGAKAGRCGEASRSARYIPGNIDLSEMWITSAAQRDGSFWNGSFQVSVRDTGPCISVAEQAKLFQEFQQADYYHPQEGRRRPRARYIEAHHRDAPPPTLW